MSSAGSPQMSQDLLALTAREQAVSNQWSALFMYQTIGAEKIVPSARVGSLACLIISLA